MMATFIRMAAGIRSRWVGLPPLDQHGKSIQRIYYANHASHLDSPILWAALPPKVRVKTRPVAAAEYWDRDIRKYMCGVFRPVFGDRCAVAAEASLPMEVALAAGDSLILYPEGTRNMQPLGQIAPFKSGLYHLKRKFPHVQVVPVVSEMSWPVASTV